MGEQTLEAWTQSICTDCCVGGQRQALEVFVSTFGRVSPWQIHKMLSTKNDDPLLILWNPQVHKPFSSPPRFLLIFSQRLNFTHAFFHVLMEWNGDGTLYLLICNTLIWDKGNNFLPWIYWWLIKIPCCSVNDGYVVCQQPCACQRAVRNFSCQNF